MPSIKLTYRLDQAGREAFRRMINSRRTSKAAMATGGAIIDIMRK